MSSQKFPRKRYETPMQPWQESRIKSERELIKKYGLKNHTEVWKAKTYLGKYRQQARALLAKIGTTNPQIKKESDQLLVHLTRIGILSMGGSLDDVLALETESVLSRRLQTLVYLKGFSMTPYQARQLISHGHIAVNNKKVTIPSYMISKDEEGQIQYTIRSPLNEISHPARPKVDIYKTEVGIPLKEPVEEKPVPKAPPKPEPTPAVIEPSAQPAESPQKTSEEKPVVKVPPKPEPTPAVIEPSAQPTAVVAVPQQPAEPLQKSAEEKPVRHAGKRKKQTKKEKKGEGA